jgi:hypothetical protein
MAHLRGTSVAGTTAAAEEVEEGTATGRTSLDAVVGEEEEGTTTTVAVEEVAGMELEEEGGGTNLTTVVGRREVVGLHLFVHSTLFSLSSSGLLPSLLGI